MSPQRISACPGASASPSRRQVLAQARAGLARPRGDPAALSSQERGLRAARRPPRGPAPTPAPSEQRATSPAPAPPAPPHRGLRSPPGTPAQKLSRSCAPAAGKERGAGWGGSGHGTGSHPADGAGGAPRLPQGCGSRRGPAAPPLRTHLDVRHLPRGAPRGAHGASRRAAPLRSTRAATRPAARRRPGRGEGRGGGGGRRGAAPRWRRHRGGRGRRRDPPPPSADGVGRTRVGFALRRGWRRLRAGSSCPARPYPRSLRGAATGPLQRGRTLTSRGPSAEIQGWKPLLAPGKRGRGGPAGRPGGRRQRGRCRWKQRRVREERRESGACPVKRFW